MPTAIATAHPLNPDTTPVVGAPVLTLLRLEGLAAAALAAVHSYTTPATLAVCGMLLHSPALLPVALIWMNHIGVDRLLGFGLKYTAGFGFTHLGGPKRRAKEAIAAS